MNQILRNDSGNLFKKVFEEIIHFLYQGESRNMSQVNAHFEEMFKYTVYDGKQTRAKSVYNTYKILTNSDPNFEKTKETHVVGCCIEILQASLLVHDDIIDNGKLRRNKPCWHLIGQDKGFGLIAVNDGCHLLAVVYKVLKQYFRSTPYYADLVDLFTDCLYHTYIGQCLDMHISSESIDWNNFTVSYYKTIVLEKTSHYSFILPVTSAMILAGITDKSLFKFSDEILIKIGEYFQIQDDYLDCYGNANVTGKDAGKDIEYAKCSWLIVQALHLANEEQKSILKSNYGKNDPACVKTVRSIYSDLKLSELYLQFEKDFYSEIHEMIRDLDKGDGKKLPKEIFTLLIDLIYQRNK